MSDIVTVTKYTVSMWHDKIIPVEVVKETEKTYTTVATNWQGKPYETRSMRSTTPIYDTFNDAKSVLVKNREDALESAKRNLDTARSKLEFVKTIKEPTNV